MRSWFRLPWPGWRQEPDYISSPDQDYYDWCGEQHLDPESLDSIHAYEEMFMDWYEGDGDDE